MYQSILPWLDLRALRRSRNLFLLPIQSDFNFHVRHISVGVTPAAPFYLDRSDKPCESFIVSQQRRGLRRRMEEGGGTLFAP